MRRARTNASTAGAALTEQIRAEARRLGFDACGFARAEPHPHEARLREWLARGENGTMRWMEREPDRRSDPRAVLAGARTVIAVAASYYRGGWDGVRGDAPPEAGGTAPEGPGGTPATRGGPPRGRIARYAWGRDYHGRMKRRLRQLGLALDSFLPDGRWVAYADTGPVLDRAWAERAGLGWIGKNTNVILMPRGSWFFLGEILTDSELPPDPPAGNHCGRCTRCIPACPTGAITAPYRLDARRCISYLTIEHRGPIPPALRPLIGTRIFGCDDCQEVCPWNRFATPTANPDFAERPEQQTPALIPLLSMDEREFRSRFEGTAVLRAKRAGFLRNVAVALGNLRDPRAVPALCRALGEDPDPVVRGHAAWALGRIGGEAARAALDTAAAGEPDPEARGEIEAARGGIDASAPTGYSREEES
jgi:epoxyqueuosine reductase